MKPQSTALQPRRRLASACRPIAFVAVLATATGCGVSNLDFQVDRRLSFQAPAEDAEVELPLTIRWDVDDFTITEPGAEAGKKSGYFAVFVDAAPQPPGKPLSWLARDDRACETTPGCPDDKWFNSHDVYRVSGTSLTLERLPFVRAKGDTEEHTITIVLVDPQGHRIGESAFTRTVKVARGRR
ncbi:MAG TPA: hypothetical protein VM938_15555 [Acidimicrobiales bacterium]|nr:hypothetical protein [Acidimicrobiales bacterium]